MVLCSLHVKSLSFTLTSESELSSDDIFRSRSIAGVGSTALEADFFQDSLLFWHFSSFLKLSDPQFQCKYFFHVSDLAEIKLL